MLVKSLAVRAMKASLQVSRSQINERSLNQKWESRAANDNDYSDNLNYRARCPTHVRNRSTMKPCVGQLRRLFELPTPCSLPLAGVFCASSQEFIQQERAAHSFNRSRGSERVCELHAARLAWDSFYNATAGTNSAARPGQPVRVINRLGVLKKSVTAIVNFGDQADLVCMRNPQAANQ